MAGVLVQQAVLAHATTDATPETRLGLTSVAAGNALVLCVSLPQSGFKVNGVTDSAGDTWTQLIDELSGGSDDAQIWVCANASAGTHTLSITWNTSRNTVFNLSEWSGLATSFPSAPTGVSNNTSGTTHSSGTATPVSGTYTAIAALSLNTTATRSADAYTDLTGPPSPYSNYGYWAYRTGISAATSTSWTTSVADTSGGAIVLLQEGVSSSQSSTSQSVRVTGQNTSVVSYGVRIGGTTSANQVIVPTSDVSTGAWIPIPSSPTTLYDKIDETTASWTDYIQSSDSPVTADVCEVALSSAGNPAQTSGHVVDYVYRKNITGGDRIDLTVRLMQGVTEIASWTHTDIGTEVTANQLLSSTQAGNITDYSNLRLRFEAVKV